MKRTTTGTAFIHYGPTRAAVVTAIGNAATTPESIGNEANAQEMKTLSGVAEAAALKANEAHVAHTIGSLLNAQI